MTSESGDCLTVTSLYYVVKGSCNTTRNEYQVKYYEASKFITEDVQLCVQRDGPRAVASYKFTAMEGTIIANSHRPTRHNTTVEFSDVGVSGGVN